MTESRLSKLDINGDIAVLTIENGKKNLLSEPEFIELGVLENFIAENPNLKALVITGAGRHFSHGADVSRFGNSEDISLISEQLEASKRLLAYIENLPIVTVAAINGGCFGGGLETALSCQFRVCSKNAFLGLPEVMHGVVPGMGGMERLTRLIGRKKALEMCLSGSMISANEALEIGLADKVSESNNCLQDAFQLVEELTDGKSLLQLHSIINVVNAADRGIENPSKGVFEQVLKELRSNKNE